MAENLLIIPCCKRKIQGGIEREMPLTFFENPAEVPILINKRNARILANPPNDLNHFMTAWNRYDGTIYRRLKEHQHLINHLIEIDKLDIIIVSALYGVINYNTPINYYDLSMRRGDVNQWLESISNSINSYCTNNQIENLYTYLRPDTYYNVATFGGLRQHYAFWPKGLRGANNINTKLANNIVSLLEKIGEENRNF